MTFDPTQNRIQTMHLTEDERTALEAAIQKHGWLFAWGSSKFRDHETKKPPSWMPDYIYRAKPAPRPTIICNGVEVPEPVREALAYYTAYWLPCPFNQSRSVLAAWYDRPEDHRRLRDGLIHLIEADAVSHAKEMAKAGCV